VSNELLPVPPVVAQLLTKLPDGNLDPARATDCGESCFASALAAIAGVWLSPGCIRGALGLPSGDGSSNAGELSDLWQRLGGSAYETTLTGDALWGELWRLRHHGRYALLLGDWITVGVLHWVLAYQRGASTLELMDPASGERLTYHASYVAARGQPSQVFVG